MKSAEGQSRTDTEFPPPVFETGASTISPLRPDCVLTCSQARESQNADVLAAEWLPVPVGRPSPPQADENHAPTGQMPIASLLSRATGIPIPAENMRAVRFQTVRPVRPNRRCSWPLSPICGFIRRTYYITPPEGTTQRQGERILFNLALRNRGPHTGSARISESNSDG